MFKEGLALKRWSRCRAVRLVPALSYWPEATRGRTYRGFSVFRSLSMPVVIWPQPPARAAWLYGLPTASSILGAGLAAQIFRIAHQVGS